jgi:hypothetical protein
MLGHIVAYSTLDALQAMQQTMAALITILRIAI